jgi:hypothetical protein
VGKTEREVSASRREKRTGKEMQTLSEPRRCACDATTAHWKAMDDVDK